VDYEQAGIEVLSLKDHRRKTLFQHAGMSPRYLSSGHLVYVTKGTLFAVPFDPERLEVRGTATRLEQVPSNPNVGFAQIDFSRTGILAYRIGGAERSRTIQWLDARGKIVPLGMDPAFYVFTRLSPDGSRLAFTMSQGSSTDLQTYDLHRDNKNRLTNGMATGYPVWSPDGRFLVFQTTGGMSWTRADGADKPQTLTKSKAIQLPASFTPDGKRLAFSEQTPGGGGEIRTVPIEGGSGQLRAGESQLFLKTSTGNNFEAFSPDGRWLAFGDAQGGNYEVYVRAFPDNGTQVKISNAGGVWPVWSRNGPELFYRTEDQHIMVVNYSVKGERLPPVGPD
jgi:serine/threonine-protein kinase